ncbi:uncharacterized protein BO80DRAFT_422641 [Aspergillus ibericus CBS 121593]|uniref:Heterokaryon incompatibility domain-containing protein n=1 Tax=Aspergillus ibericus CBS 121593 TaxID=1448316 RepID=A0A395H820_9EURO|nr:hypothetical protein BO80DRAFT_422641 [Aspergillus ibericus CBS 121593]RAL03709.1 hypothetical protein BO80DRAFT_422641 [Aspergillus ibericus CBS 121593]
MPAFSTVAELNSSKLHNEYWSSTGPDFIPSFRHKTISNPRPVPPSDQAKLYPSRLVTPDGTSVRIQPPYPEYVVISYTWGRWKHRTREQDTEVKGGHWKVPANTLFTRDDLDTAVRNIAKGRHVWLDVLCIPQLDGDPEHGVEISKQGEIFRSASAAAVWLCSGGEETLAEICSWAPDESQMVDPDVLQVPNLLDIRSGHVDLSETRRRLQLIIALTTDVPWTTSLWTLQEAALRLDAVFYDKSGHQILHQQSGNPLTIRHLVKTLRYIRVALHQINEPGNPRSILQYPETMRATDADIDSWFQATDAVNQINLHNLMSMNAGQLLLTSTHRTCRRPHDRVYGIMGAIGVTIPVDYTRDPGEVMNAFLVELHNAFPAEMQSFHRSGAIRPSIRPWLADEDCDELGMVRQGQPPLSRPFRHVSPTGDLIVKELLLLSDRGMDDLAMRFLSETVLPALDNYAFHQISKGMISTQGCESTGRESYVRGCLVLRYVSTRVQLGLVPLGTVKGLEDMGWSWMYLLVGSEDAGVGARRFRRLGLVLLVEEMMVDVTHGEFHIY